MIIYLQAIESAEDRDKFERIFVRYRNLMFYVAKKIVHNQQDAEDAVHQAFVSIIENLEKIRNVDCPETRSYIVIIVERKAIDIRRKNAKVITLEDYDDCGIDIPLPGDNGIADAIAKLPNRYREILLLHYDNGLSTRELAKLLHMKRGSVQKLIWRAKHALQEILEQEGVTL